MNVEKCALCQRINIVAWIASDLLKSFYRIQIMKATNRLASAAKASMCNDASGEFGLQNRMNGVLKIWLTPLRWRAWKMIRAPWGG